MMYSYSQTYTGNKKALVCHNDEISEWMSIKQDVPQGYVASLHLFAMYTEMVFSKSSFIFICQIKVHGKPWSR